MYAFGAPIAGGPRPIRLSAFKVAPPAAVAPATPPVVTVGTPPVAGRTPSDDLAQALLADAAQARPRSALEAIGGLAEFWRGNKEHNKYLSDTDAKKKADDAAMADALTSLLGDTTPLGIAPEAAKRAIAINPTIGTALLPKILDARKKPDAPNGYRWRGDGALEPIPGGPATTKGDAPSGYRWSADGSTLEPIPGGPASAAPLGFRWKADGTLEPIPGGPNKNNPKFDDVSGIRKEIQALPAYKNLAQAKPIYEAMKATAGNDSRASDLNLVYGLGKIMDPTSVVREGEMVMAKNTASLPDWFIGTINSINGGAALTPETRAAILREAYIRTKGYEDSFNAAFDPYKGIADRNGIDLRDIQPSFGVAALPWDAPSAGGAPAVINNDADYDKLPSGTLFIGPDGKTRKKP